jgi:leucine dehydrogenase
MIATLPSTTHETVRHERRDDLGVDFVVAIHSTRLGPAFGGARMWPYRTLDEAIDDALRLSEGMTFKNAVAELGVGGGKAVIWHREPGKASRTEIFSAFGDFVGALEGRYITAEDVGTTVSDMLVIASRTPHVAGLPPAAGRAGGDPSPWTALGVFCAMEAALAEQGERLGDVTVGVQGCGAVGLRLCALLADAGARLVVSDISEARVAEAVAKYGAQAVSPQDILGATVDVLAPCALGGALNRETIPQIRARLVVGAANNQLASPDDALALARRGIVYVPDFVANAGGIICVLEEYRGREAGLLEAKVRAIGPRVRGILQRARLERRRPLDIALDMAHAALDEAPEAAGA